MKSESIYVYVLRLENNKWYIGKTANIEHRIKKHKEQDSCKWIKFNKVISIEEIIENGDEKSITLKYMKKYGWQNVRGYAWSQINLKKPPNELDP